MWKAFNIDDLKAKVDTHEKDKAAAALAAASRHRLHSLFCRGRSHS